MSDPREIIHRGRRYVVRTSTVGGQVYYHVCPYSGHNPFDPTMILDATEVET